MEALLQAIRNRRSSLCHVGQKQCNSRTELAGCAPPKTAKLPSKGVMCPNTHSVSLVCLALTRALRTKTRGLRKMVASNTRNVDPAVGMELVSVNALLLGCLHMRLASAILVTGPQIRGVRARSLCANCVTLTMQNRAADCPAVTATRSLASAFAKSPPMARRIQVSTAATSL